MTTMQKGRRYLATVIKSEAIRPEVKLKIKKRFSIVDDISFFENMTFTFRESRGDSSFIWVSHDNNEGREKVLSNGCQGK